MSIMSPLTTPLLLPPRSSTDLWSRTSIMSVPNLYAETWSTFDPNTRVPMKHACAEQNHFYNIQVLSYTDRSVYLCSNVCSMCLFLSCDRTISVLFMFAWYQFGRKSGSGTWAGFCGQILGSDMHNSSSLYCSLEPWNENVCFTDICSVTLMKQFKKSYNWEHTWGHTHTYLMHAIKFVYLHVLKALVLYSMFVRIVWNVLLTTASHGWDVFRVFVLNVFVTAASSWSEVIGYLNVAAFAFISMYHVFDKGPVSRNCMYPHVEQDRKLDPRQCVIGTEGTFQLIYSSMCY